MSIVDSHCHLDQIPLEASTALSVAGLLEHARQNDVEYFLCVSIDLDNIDAVLAAATEFAPVFASVGVHPNSHPGQTIDKAWLKDKASHEKVIAIGETGLDYFRSEGDLDWQRHRFSMHIELAAELGKPLIVHSRDAKADTLRILQQAFASDVNGVMHCFADDWDMAEQAIALGFYISFSGIVTFKNAHELKRVAQNVPLDRLLIETDSPYLAPVPHRGKINQPAYVRHVADYVAELRGISYAELAKASTDNFFNLFTLAQALRTEKG